MRLDEILGGGVEWRRIGRKRLAVRREKFGGVVYNKATLRYAYVGATMTNVLAGHDDVDVFETDLENMPDAILSAPIRIYYELTRECNLRCRHCFNSSGSTLSDQQTLEEVLMTLDGLRKDAVFDVRFTGGELTRREDWFEILEHALDLGLAVSCNTNGVYDDSEDVAEKFAELSRRGLSQVTTSLDGDRKTHDWLRGRGSFDKTVASLRLMKRLGVPLRINSLLFKTTIPHIDYILGIAAETCKEINFFYARPFGRASMLDGIMLDNEELQEVSRYIESVREDPKYAHLNILHGIQVIQDNSHIDRRFGLRIGGPDAFTRFNINSDGSMWAGGYSEHVSKLLHLGNVRDYDFSVQYTWRHSPKLEAIRRISEMQQEICNTCEERYKTCGGFDLEMVLAGDKRYCTSGKMIDVRLRDV